MKILVAALASVALAVLAGCGNDTLPSFDPSPQPLVTPPPTGLVQGRLIEVGGPAPGKPRPIAGTVTFTATNGAVATTTVDATGTFAIELSPGDYRIVGTSPSYNGGKATCLTAKPITTLTTTGIATADVICSIP